MLIFLSKHVSKSKTPALTSHSTGNFSNNIQFGGSAKEIGNTFPSFQKHYMKKLYENKNNLLKYDLIIEATHHGPTFLNNNPILFIEIGSSDNEWQDKQAISIICKCVLETIKVIQLSIDKLSNNYSNSEDSRIAIGIGGTHYPSKFNDLILFSNVAFGSIISKHNLGSLDNKMLDQMKTKSIENIKYIYVDGKGLGKEKERVLQILKNQELEYIFV
jgi:D-aminoacyl-tRNA deacylase